MRAWAFQTRAPSVRNLSPPHSYRINGRRADWRPRMASKWEPPARGGSQLPPAAEASIHFGLARREGWRASECTCRAKWVAEEAGRPAEAGPPAAGAGSLAGPLLRQSVAGAGVAAAAAAAAAAGAGAAGRPSGPQMVCDQAAPSRALRAGRMRSQAGADTCHWPGSSSPTLVVICALPKCSRASPAHQLG